MDKETWTFEFGGLASFEGGMKAHDGALSSFGHEGNHTQEGGGNQTSSSCLMDQ